MIYPEEFPPFRINYAEQKVYQALSVLGDDFDVFYNKAFARKHPKEAQLYEIDFLVMDLRGGRLNHIYVIEVKGGNMYYSSNRNQWKSGSNYLETGPDQQAMGYVGNLINRYHAQVAFKVPLTWLLWFPDGLRNKREYLPSHLSSWRILDQYSLRMPLEFLDTASNKQREDHNQYLGISLEDYEAVIKKDLTQTFVIQPNTKSLLDDMQLSFEQLENQQKLFFKGLLGIPHLAIEGGAGSGKTVLAKFAASHFAEQGKKVLLLCFNQHLKTQLGEGLHPSVRVNTIHSFMVEEIDRLDKDWFETENKQDPALYDKRLPEKFIQALQQVPYSLEERFDTLLIDEGQDMDEHWIATAMTLLKPTGQVLIFFDHKQNIFRKSFSLPKSASWANIQLLYNHRNSQKINTYINKLLNLDIQSAKVPEGLPVKLRPYQEESLIEELDRVVKTLIFHEKLTFSQVVLLVDGSTTDWDLEGTILPQTQARLAWFLPGIEQSANTVYMTSINRFKGCESDVILLLLKGPLEPIVKHNIRYTQLSRAKKFLWIFEKAAGTES